MFVCSVQFVINNGGLEVILGVRGIWELFLCFGFWVEFVKLGIVVSEVFFCIVIQQIDFVIINGYVCCFLFFVFGQFISDMLVIVFRIVYMNKFDWFFFWIWFGEGVNYLNFILESDGLEVVYFQWIFGIG